MGVLEKMDDALGKLIDSIQLTNKRVDALEADVASLRNNQHAWLDFLDEKNFPEMRRLYLKEHPDAKGEKWLFTFGYNHQYPNRFIEIEGTYETARKEMFRRYGSKWAFQYPESHREILIMNNVLPLSEEEL